MTSLTRKLGPFDLMPMGWGCHGLLGAYGPPVSAEQVKHLMLQALDLGVQLVDVSSCPATFLQGSDLAQVLSEHRSRLVLSVQCGVSMASEHAGRVIDGRPEAIFQHAEDWLRLLNTDVLDVLYLYRKDRNVPIEDSVGAMADLVQQGKVRCMGLCEVSASTLRQANAEHPIAAVQTEYALWSRQPEVALLKATQEMGVAMVASSPLGRGFLTAQLADSSRLDANDERRQIPRFDVINYPANLRCLDRWLPMVELAQVTPAQMALAWLLHKAPHVIPIPGTTHPVHLAENLKALALRLGPDQMEQMERCFMPDHISGPRHSRAKLQDMEFEDFDG